MKCIVPLCASLVSASVARADLLNTPEPNLETRLGGISAFLPVVDARLATLKLDTATITRIVKESLSAARLRVVTEQEALHSFRGVAVLHVGVNAVIDQESHMVAAKIDIECMRPGAIGRKQVPLIIAWRTGGVGLYPATSAERGITDAVQGYLDLFLSKYQAVVRASNGRGR